MAETLRGHEEELALLVNENRLGQVELSGGIEKIEKARIEAVAGGLGRQAATATRLNIHYLFEQSQRAGVPVAVFKQSLIDRGLIDGELSPAFAGETATVA